MTKVIRKGSQQARNELPALIEAAEKKGQTTVITRRGRPVAALVPVEAMARTSRQQPLLPLEGSGQGFWGADSSRTLRRLRAEWSR